MFGWLLSLIWQSFLGLFGKSDSQKLGAEEEKVKTQAEVLQEVKTAHEIEDKNAAASDVDIAGRLSKWKRQ